MKRHVNRNIPKIQAYEAMTKVPEHEFPMSKARLKHVAPLRMS